MPTYKGRRPGTRRIVIWTGKGKPTERVFEGSKADAEGFEAQLRLELLAASGAPRAVPRCSKVFEEYAAHAEVHLGKATWHKVRIYQVATLSEFFGALALDQVTAASLDAYKLARLAKIGPTSVNNELRVLGAVLTWAKDAGYQVPALKWRKVPEAGQGRVQVWTDAELDAIFRSARSEYQPLVPMLIFMLNTGVRKGEAIAAEWSWIDDSADLIRIPATREWSPKNGKPREVPLGDAVKAAFSGERDHPRYLFPTERGNRKRRAFPEKLFTRVLEVAGVEGHPHMTRHTFASHFLRETKDLFLLAQILGHSHTRTTELYSHLLPGHLERGRNAVRIMPKTMAMTMAKKNRNQR